MDSKFFVSCEAARLLKEKGYNKLTEQIIDEDNFMMDSHYKLNSELSESVCSAPTKAEAIDWLESKEMFIGIGGVGSGKLQKWSYSVFDYNTCDNYESEYIYPTRLEAEDAAILKALELL